MREGDAPPALAREVPAAVQGLVGRCLEDDPEDRVPLADFIETLHDAIDDMM